MKRRNNIILGVALACAASPAMMVAGPAAQQESTPYAQDSESGLIVIEPLFEYPLPPDTMSNLRDRANFLVDNFWKPMDFKSKSTVDQNALNDAFGVYVTSMQFADEKNMDASAKALIKSIESNPALSLQFAKAAEENLYGERASVWNDRMFLLFVDNVIRNKQVKKERKVRYEMMRKKIASTLQGTVPPEFDYITLDGKTAHYSPNGIITVIEFGDPLCFDCRMAKLKMDTDVAFSSLVEKGKVNVLFINVEPFDGWQESMKDYPARWHVGAAEDIDEIYDLRFTPSIYVIDREGKVAAKNVTVAMAMQIASAAANQ